MLSYRHAFHAGNHADVLKHFVLSLVLDYYTCKDKPFWYIDTHAGAGMYALDSGYAAQNAEYRAGIARLWQRPGLPEALAAYVEQVRTCNPGGALTRYPGSPAVAQGWLRPDDRMRLFELHPSDLKLLQQYFSAAGRKVLIEGQDGFAGLKAVLPPPPRRAVVLIDPPYEQKQDYARVVDALKDALQRFASGTYLLWYPLLQRPESTLMLNRLGKMNLKSWLHVSLTVQAPAPDGFGMHGSGLFIINPPWTLPGTLTTVMPYLRNALALDDSAAFTLEHVIP